METIFSAKSVEAAYGQMQVLWGIDLELHKGESTLLLGANGAGKTTLLRTLLGLVPLRRGEILFHGESIGHQRTDLRIRRGIGFMTEQGVFPNLSIQENLEVGGYSLGRTAVLRRIAELYTLFPDLAARPREMAGSLSGGQRKMLAVAKALVAGPEVLVMDEPSSGLSPRYVQEVVSILKRVHETGLTLLVAEQNVKFLEAADRALVLDGGRITFDGTVQELEGNDAIHQAYFGLGGEVANGH